MYCTLLYTALESNRLITIRLHEYLDKCHMCKSVEEISFPVQVFWYRLHTATATPEVTKTACWDPDLTAV